MPFSMNDSIKFYVWMNPIKFSEVEEVCIQDPTGLPVHMRPLPEGFPRHFGAVVPYNCEYGYGKMGVLEMSCTKKEGGALMWEVCGSCDCMLLLCILCFFTFF